MTRPAEYMFGCAIEENNALVAVDGDDGIHCRSDNPGDAGFADPQRFLRMSLFGNISEHHHHAFGESPVILDRRSAFFNGDALPRFADQHGCGRPGTDVIKRSIEHLCQLMLQGVRAAPFRELFRHRIHKGDIPRRIRCNNTITDAAEGRCKPPLAFTKSRFHPVFVQGHLYSNVELALFERLENIPECIRYFGPLERMFIRICRQIDNRNCIEIADLICCGNAIHLSA